MSRLQQIKRGLEKILEAVVISIMGVLVLTVLWQVVSRYALSAPSSWSEELAKILLIWASLLGSALAYAEKSHLGVDYFVGKLAPRPRHAVALVVHVLVIAAAVYMMIYGGIAVTQNAFDYSQTTAALKLCWGYVYLALPITGLFFVFFAIEFIWEAVAGLGGSKEVRHG